MEHNTNREVKVSAAQLDQIKNSIADSLINAIQSGATLEQAFAAHAEDIFNKYPGVAAALTADAFLQGFDLGSTR